jgi:hypothetical protein
MDKKFWISGIVATVLFYFLSFIVHGLILSGDYMQIMSQTPMFRTEDDAFRHMPFMLLADLIMGFAFAWIYRQGISAGEPWLQQGVRFGVAAALLSSVPHYIIYYVIQPWPAVVVIKQVVLQTITVVIVGIVVAWLNRSTAPTQ